jgi:hypothetical protein
LFAYFFFTPLSFAAANPAPVYQRLIWIHRWHWRSKDFDAPLRSK